MLRIGARTKVIRLVGLLWMLSFVASGCGDSGGDGTKNVPSEETRQKFTDTIKAAAKSGLYGKTGSKAQ